ncbi:toprim domain-containing protein [Streptococcus gallolyticus]|nr:toprim domain-containing protein [Streptococcus gallolyticus]MBY5041794.1 toprim domain-containing protein [Streptococcus gallolyticus]
MTEEVKELPNKRNYENRVNQAVSRDILEVAEALGMEMKRISTHEYYWTEHDSLKINTRKNSFRWYSRTDTYGNPINLVQAVKEVKFKEALHFLETGEFKEASQELAPREEFKYYLEKYEQSFNKAYDYLRKTRGLDEDTIRFFGQQGVLAQANKKAKDGSFESVLVFKSLDRDGNVIGASLQGIKPRPDLYEKKGYLKQLMANSDGMSGLSVDIGTPKRLVFAEAPIDLMSYYELNKDVLSDVRLVAMDGLREATISRYFVELLAELNGHDDYQIDRAKVGNMLAGYAVSSFFDKEENQNLITLAVDNDEAGKRFIEELKEKGIVVQSALPPTGKDWNEHLVNMKKQESIKKAPESILEQEKNAEGTIGDFPDKQEAAPLPEANESQPLNDLSPNQTQPQPLLHFSTNAEAKSINKRFYHPISEKELAKLNRYAPTFQQSASWYLNELADSKVYYFYQEADKIQSLQVSFDKDKFIHLTGVFPYKEGQSAETALEELASGNGNYDNILLANKGAAFDKLKVLPELPAIIEADSFYFDDLSEVPKLQSLDLDKAIKSGDEDILLALRTVDETTFPASLMKLRSGLIDQLAQKADEKTILGVYRERNGQIEKLSINEQFVKDNGKQFEEILRNKAYEEVVINDKTNPEKFLDSDGDGYTDLEERALGSDPHNAKSTPGHLEQNQEPTPQSVESNPLEGEKNMDKNQTKLFDNLADMTVPATTSEEPEDTRSISEIIAAKDTKALSKRMKEGIKEYFDSDKYKTFLQTMSKFPSYSIGNINLILAQNPKAIHVASFKKWKDDFGRSVNKGEKSLRIWAPMLVDKKDKKTNEVILDENGKPVKEVYFKLVPVFDVSQTNGKELPRPINELTGSYEDYGKLFKAAKEVSNENGVPISFVGNADGARGYYDSVNRKIAVLEGMSEQQTLKTVFHEMAHSDLHGAGDGYTRSERELQAESVAFVVASHYGLDTGEYSFGYLAGWSRDKEGLSDLEAQLEIVQKEASSLIKRLDSTLEKYQTMEVKKDSFQEKLSQYKTQTPQPVPTNEKTEAQTEPKKANLSNEEMSL